VLIRYLSVVGLVIPWNYPLMMLAWKMGACLAAGNTMVLKPAKVLRMLSLYMVIILLTLVIQPQIVWTQ